MFVSPPRRRTQTLLTEPPAATSVAQAPAYLPPKQIDADALKTIFLPFGFIHLFQALDLWGRATHADSWSGEEITARDLSHIGSPAQWPGVERIEAPPQDPGVITLPGVPSRRYRVATTSGFRLFASESAARSVWKTQRRKLKCLYERERAARPRVEDARLSLRQCLFAAKLKSYLLEPRTGAFLEIGQTRWGGETASAIFELHEPGTTNRAPRPHEKPFVLPTKTGRKIFVGYPLIRADELHALLSPPAKAQSRDDTQTHDPGGRPKKFNEDAVIRELIRLADLDGLPPTKAELQRHILEWCQTTFNEEPSLSTVKRWLAKWSPQR